MNVTNSNSQYRGLRQTQKNLIFEKNLMLLMIVFGLLNTANCTDKFQYTSKYCPALTKRPLTF